MNHTLSILNLQIVIRMNFSHMFSQIKKHSQLPDCKFHIWQSQSIFTYGFELDDMNHTLFILNLQIVIWMNFSHMFSQIKNICNSLFANFTFDRTSFEMNNFHMGLHTSICLKYFPAMVAFGFVLVLHEISNQLKIVNHNYRKPFYPDYCVHNQHVHLWHNLYSVSDLLEVYAKNVPLFVKSNKFTISTLTGCLTIVIATTQRSKMIKPMLSRKTFATHSLN